MGERPVMAAAAAKIAANFGITTIIKMLSEPARIAGAHGVPASQIVELLIATRMDAIIAADGGGRDWSALGQPPAA